MDNLVDLYKQHQVLVAREFSLTSHTDPLCIHEVAELKILMHENARDRSVLFPERVTLNSQHFRTHIPETIERYGDLRASERGTERMNQEMVKVYDQVKRIRNPKKRAQKFLERIVINQTAKKTQKAVHQNK